MIVGTEWLIEAAECDPDKLRDKNALRAMFVRIVSDLNLKVIDSVWHKFPGEGGVTGLALLTESHLACHTYPEHRTATFNLYCCRSRAEWNWQKELRSVLDAQFVNISKIERGKIAAENLKSEILDVRSQAVGGEQ